MTRAERIRALLDEYARQRYQNEREQRAREREAFVRDPELETLRARSLALATQSLRAAMDEPDKEKRRAIAGQMRQKGALINAETRRRLRALGLAEDYLEEHYRCPECRDTGYVGDAPARFCACFERRLAAMETEGAPQEQTFETFNAAFVPEEGGQRERLIKARDALEKFADRYPDVPQRNIVLSGAGGLGKSFLLNCVYERVSRRGYAATRVTAFRMFDEMRKRHMSGGEDADGFAALFWASPWKRRSSPRIVLASTGRWGGSKGTRSGTGMPTLSLIHIYRQTSCPAGQAASLLPPPPQNG